MEPLILFAIATALVGLFAGAVLILYPNAAARWLWRNYKPGNDARRARVVRIFGLVLVLLAVALAVAVVSAGESVVT